MASGGVSAIHRLAVAFANPCPGGSPFYILDVTNWRLIMPPKALRVSLRSPCARFGYIPVENASMLSFLQCPIAIMVEPVPSLPSNEAKRLPLFAWIRKSAHELWKACLKHTVWVRIVCTLAGGIIAGIWIGTVFYFGQRQRLHLLENKISGSREVRFDGNQSSGTYIPVYLFIMDYQHIFG